MDIDYQSMVTMISQIFWPIGRFSGLFLSAPFFSSTLIAVRIKVLFILLLSFVCSFMVPVQLSLEHFTGLYLVYMVQEVSYGILMGFVLQIVFQVFLLVGQIISMQAGLGFAVMVDPTSKASVPLVSQIYSFMILLLFLSLNGHTALLEVFINSFKIMPVGTIHIDKGVVWGVIAFSGWMMNEAVLIAIPAIISLLLVSLAFGIVARVAPQLNVFALGFPVTLIMSIFIMLITLTSMGDQMVSCLETGMNLITGMLH
jgi:flagellar biosynthetic protein FliR